MSEVAETETTPVAPVVVVPTIQTGEEALAAALVKAALEKAERDKLIPPPVLEPTLQRHYDILVNHITGESPNVVEQNTLNLSGRVTEGDLLRAGVDIEWLLRINSISDAGYHLAK